MKKKGEITPRPATKASHAQDLRRPPPPCPTREISEFLLALAGGAATFAARDGSVVEASQLTKIEQLYGNY